MSYSVLMSVYKKEKPGYLRESINSVLKQTLLTDDFVIVCDGPLTEALDAVLSELQGSHADIIRIHRLAQNRGLGRALNEGLALCRNEIVARMDSDDICFPDRMEKEYKLLVEQKLDLVGSTLIEFEQTTDQPTGSRMVPADQKSIEKFARRRNPFNHPTVMYRKQSVERVGSYQDFYLFEDYYLWIRMLMADMKVMNIEEPLLYMRTGDGMLERRGGIRYAEAIWHFRLYLRKSGFSSVTDFLITAPGHILVALLPSGFRKYFYQKLLRKKQHDVPGVKQQDIE